MKDKYEQIDEIMTNFDFEKVKKCMTLLEWTWRDEGIPTISMLRSAAMGRLITAYDGCKDMIENDKDCSPPTYHSASGGFFATATYYTGEEDFEEGIYLTLHFSVESWEN